MYLPRLIGEGRSRELAFTGKNVSAQEGLDMGLVNAVFETKEEMMHHVSEIAIQIAQKSPLTVRGIKNVMNYSRDHSVADGLQYVATWNASMLLSEDIQIAMKAIMSKTLPKFRD